MGATSTAGADSGEAAKVSSGPTVVLTKDVELDAAAVTTSLSEAISLGAVVVPTLRSESSCSSTTGTAVIAAAVAGSVEWEVDCTQKMEPIAASPRAAIPTTQRPRELRRLNDSAYASSFSAGISSPVHDLILLIAPRTRGPHDVGISTESFQEPGNGVNSWSCRP